MSPLRLTVVFAVLIAARPAAAAPSEQDIIKAAEARAAACAAAHQPPEVCANVSSLLSGYATLLKMVKDCSVKPCTADFLTRIFEADRKADELEHSLPDAARADETGRPFLRFSLLVTQRAATALAAVDPKAKPPFRFDPKVDAPRAVEAACMDAPASCENARAALAGVADLDARVKACEAKPCAFEELDLAAMKAEGAMHSYELVHDTKADLLTVFSVINSAQAAFARVIAADAAARLKRLQDGTKTLNGGLDALAKGGTGDPVAMEAQVVSLTGLFREASLGQDRVEAFLISDKKAGQPREALNDAAAGLATSRSRLLALETARGLKAPALDGAVAGGPGGSGGEGRALNAFVAQAPNPGGLLDRRTIPKPAPVDGKAPPILPESPGFFEMLGNTRSTDPAKRADALRRLGLTTTIGDPSGRAPLVHRQQYADTCAIVSQQEVLASLHLLPTGSQNDQETALRDEAARRGFYRGGTPSHYTADLLVDRGVIVTKKKDAPLSDLDAAVRRGGMVIANVDARYLWDYPAKNVLGHAIVITGAEIQGDRTLGYYINDSGSLPEGRGRFVPLEQFRKAWDAHTKSYAEVR